MQTKANLRMEQSTQQVRLKNLRMLHGRAGGSGAPTSILLVDHLRKHGVVVTADDISAIYAKKRDIGDRLASQIEKAFELPSGWLSVDHEFIYALSPGEALALQMMSRLSPDIKANVLALVTSIAGVA